MLISVSLIEEIDCPLSKVLVNKLPKQLLATQDSKIGEPKGCSVSYHLALHNTRSVLNYFLLLLCIQAFFPFESKANKSESQTTQWQTKGILAALKDSNPRVIFLALTLLEDDDSGVRASAAWALVQMGEAAKEQAPKIAELLAELLKDQAGRVSALSALGRMGEAAKEQAPKIAELLKDQVGGVRKTPAGVSAKLRPGKAA